MVDKELERLIKDLREGIEKVDKLFEVLGLERTTDNIVKLHTYVHIMEIQGKPIPELEEDFNFSSIEHQSEE